MGFGNVFIIAVQSVSVGLAATVAVYVFTDIYFEEQFPESWWAWIGTVTAFGLLISPRFLRARAQRTKCTNCDSPWAMKPGDTKLLRTYPMKDNPDVEIEEYAEYWNCTRCGYQKRRRTSYHNTDKVAF